MPVSLTVRDTGREPEARTRSPRATWDDVEAVREPPLLALMAMTNQFLQSQYILAHNLRGNVPAAGANAR